VILRFSAVVARYRRRVLLAAVAVYASAMLDAVLAPPEPAVALVAVSVVAALAVVMGAVLGTAFRWQQGPRFEVDEPRRAFRTPRSATPVFLMVFLLAAVAFPAEVGGRSWTHGDRDVGWILVMALFGLLTLPFAAVGWRGYGIALTPDGIHADRNTGTLVIPWTALTAGQPRAITAPTYSLEPILARPEQVSRRGLLLRRNRISFEGTQPAFVAAAIQHYAAHPANRPMIGTPAEHRRLIELLAVPPGTPKLPPSRRHIAGLAAVGVLVFGVAVAGNTWVDLTIGRHSVLGYASHSFSYLMVMLSFHLFAAAVRARRRPGAQPAPPQPEQHVLVSPPASRPSWARDVTNGS
jgi:hypothetical protein